ncbi:HopJ type III effector protein [Vibrio scophthalmi]|uniref:HopJ type III effector protein n=1 Tax=Vibrio scophthalmi TaxID=45658 RepID=UPI002FF0DE65
MELTTFIHTLEHSPETIEFDQTMAIIERYYTFTPTAFTNGDTFNEVNQNNGSCKIFAFGQENQLSESQTLACFGRYYREDVLNHPTGDDHANIRNFMQTGWQGVNFEGQALADKG